VFFPWIATGCPSGVVVAVASPVERARPVEAIEESDRKKTENEVEGIAMRERNCVGRGWRRWQAIAVVLGLVASGVSCVNLAADKRPQPAPARLLGEGEAQIFMTRLGQYPKRLVTAAERVLVRCYFDPELVDLTRVRSYSLWRQDEPGGAWTRVAAASAGALPFELTPGEGLIGLRASATLADGSERLVPGPGDAPALVLCADKSPPELSWVAPQPLASIRGLKTIQLEWTAAELQFGDAPVVLEWSADRGETWKPLGKVPGSAGHQRFVWRVPAEVCSDILVRLSASDMAGHRSSEILALSYPGSVTTGGPAIAAEIPSSTRERAATQETVSAAPAASAAASQAPPLEAAAAPAASAAGPAAPPAVTPRSSPAPPAVSLLPPPDAPTPEAGDPDAPAGEVSPTSPSPSPAPSPAASAVRVELDPLPRGILAGGAVQRLTWQSGGAPASLPARLEHSGDGGATWQLIGTTTLGAGSFDWRLPASSQAQSLVRLTATLEDRSELESRLPAPLVIDAEPPRIDLGAVPTTSGRRLALRVALSDPGGSGVARTEVYLRARGGRWEPVAAAADWKPPQLELDLAGREEGEHDMLLRAVDAVGNATPAPVDLETADTPGPLPAPRSLITFHLDATPPAFAARATPLAWVSGFAAEVQVEADWSDAVPPIVLESLGDDGTWREAGRWATIAPGQNRLSFEVPAGLKEHVVRLKVADRVGNLATATVGPRPVESPIRLATFTESRSYPSQGAEKIAWKLHPAALEVRQALRVAVDHQPRREGPWTAVYADLPPEAESYWDLPRGDSGEHRLRVRLLRAGKVIGEEISPPFTIQAEDLQPTVVGIHADSTYYSDQARSQVEKYFNLLQVQPQAATEIERLRASALSSYTRALEIDPDNYHAAYGLAQLLNRTDPERNAPEVLRWLQRTIEIKPDHFWALNDLGAAAIRDGDFQRAEDLLGRSAGIQGSAIVLYNLGLALFYGGKMAEARQRLEAALKAAGSGDLPQADVYFFLVHSYMREGDMERARGLFQAKASVFTSEMRQELERALQG
jgi:Flp pilus assembly protein TadD